MLRVVGGYASREEETWRGGKTLVGDGASILTYMPHVSGERLSGEVSPSIKTVTGEESE